MLSCINFPDGLLGNTWIYLANRFLREFYLPDHNARLATAAEESGSALIPYVGRDLADILCVQEERTVGNDNTVRYNGKCLLCGRYRTRLSV